MPVHLNPMDVMGEPRMLSLTLLLLASGVLPPSSAEPNTCQPRSKHPFMPIYHIIGNVTTAPDGTVTNVERINDVYV